MIDNKCLALLVGAWARELMSELWALNNVLAEETDLEQHVEVTEVHNSYSVPFTSKVYKVSYLEELVNKNPEGKLGPNGDVRALDRMWEVIYGIEDAAADLRKGEADA